MRILIVEDSLDVAKVLRHIIYLIVGDDLVTIHEVSSLAEARKALTVFQPDIVFFDIELPDGTGFDIVRETQERNLPLICMSAHAPEHYLTEILAARVLAFLPKPFDRNDVEKPLREALTLVSQEQQRQKILETIWGKYDTAHVLLQEKEHELSIMQGQFIEEKRFFAEAVSQQMSNGNGTELHQAPLPLRAIIVDDEKAQRSALRRKIENTFGAKVALVGEAFSVDSAITVIKEHEPDLLFLDIELIGGTGFDVLDAFPDPHFAVIIVTSFPDYGARAFRYDTMDYLLKPIDPIHLEEAVERVFALRKSGGELKRELKRVSNKASDIKSNAELLPSPPNVTKHATEHNGTTQTEEDETGAETLQLRVRTSGTSETLFLPFSRILAVESRSNKVIVIMDDGMEYEASGTLKTLETRLPAALFVRCHASYMVNMNAIFSQSALQLTLTGNRIIPISRKYKEQTHQKIADYLDQKIIKNG